MKIIDLLNKIANGEEVPKKIRYKNKIFEHWDNGNIQDYWHKGNKSLFDDFIDCSRYTDLNDEIVILDEEDEFIDIEEIEYKPRKVQNAINGLIKNQKKIINKLKEEGK